MCLFKQMHHRQRPNHRKRPTAISQSRQPAIGFWLEIAEILAWCCLVIMPIELIYLGVLMCLHHRW